METANRKLGADTPGGQSPGGKLSNSVKQTGSTRHSEQSSSLFSRAEKVIPGGVNSPVRAFKGVGGTPRFIRRGEGPFVFDEDGNRYIDYVASWGPLLFGHGDSLALQAVQEAASRGLSFGAPTELEVRFAEMLSAMIPWVEQVRAVSSGTEATMTAVRLARGYTGRERIVKFNGCYHGHADCFLVQAGSGVATFGIAGSPGVPKATVELTASIEFNDLDLFVRTANRIGPSTIAAVIVEPVPGNMGLVLPEPGFLEGLRQFCSDHGIVLIFDEVMSGFRVGVSGAAGRFGILPDLVVYGKVIGGGLPLAAFGGRREIMSKLAPSGPVYQAGTLSGNPLAMSVACAVLERLRQRDPFPELEELAKQLCAGLAEAAASHQVPIQVSHCGSMFGLFFAPQAVKNFSDAKASDVARFNSFFHLMLEQGIYLAPSAFEAAFIGTTHTPDIISQTVNAANRAFAALKG